MKSKPMIALDLSLIATLGTLTAVTFGFAWAQAPAQQQGQAPAQQQSQAAQQQSQAPDETRFTKKVLVEGLNEAFHLDVDSRSRVYWVERTTGNVKRLDEATGQVTLLAKLPSTVVAEGGMLGIALAPDFDTSRQIYFNYTTATTVDSVTTRDHRLVRYTLGADDLIDMSSEVIVMKWHADSGGHMGGGMTWDANGNLYLGIGDGNTASQYSPYQFTNPGGASQDALRTSSNVNDLRGKILRIHPEPNGTYTIPAGNLFPPGTPNTRPEIYVMGTRNPYRPQVDSRTGNVLWGDIGPDAGRDSVGIGPMGYDEFNVATSPGNFGWPMFIGYNRAYNRYDYATRTYAEPFDPARPVNPSPNNTGARELPPARVPLIAYPYGVSEEYPFFSSGGRAAISGPIYHRSDLPANASRAFPAYYEGKWFIIDYVRNWIYTVTMNEASDRVVAIERFAPKLTFLNPIDTEFGPNGDLYIVEYGRTGLGKISKIEYNPGNRAPEVSIDADRTSGATPLRVSLSSTGTVDYDNDALTYEWVVTPEAGGTAQRFTTATPTVTLSRAGAYKVVLTARDPAGATGTKEMRILAGNEAPRVSLEVTRGNRSFYFPGTAIEYRVNVTDREDGTVTPANVQVTTEFIPAGLTPAQAEQARALAPEASARNIQAFALIANSDCRACHSEQTRMVGPSFREISDRYRGQADAADRLAQKIITGGSGVWGELPMPPHPAFTPVEATALAQYALSIGQADATPARVAAQGAFSIPASTTPPGGASLTRATQSGSYLLRATYTDRGATGATPLTTSEVVLLRQPRIAPQDADFISEGTTYAPSSGDPGFVINKSGAYIGLRGIDLTGIDSISVGVLTRFYTWSHFIGGTVEVRLDSPTGPLVGAPVRVIPPTAPPVQAANAQPNAQGPNAQGPNAQGPNAQGPAAPGGAAPGAAAPGAAAPAAPQQGARAANPSVPTFTGARVESPISFPVRGVTGTRDVYVVFRNENETNSLFLVVDVGFKPAASPLP